MQALPRHNREPRDILPAYELLWNVALMSTDQPETCWGIGQSAPV